MSIIPNLLLAHFIGDYLLQTNWLAARKGQSREGLLIHTGFVLAMSVVAVAPYVGTLWPVLLVLFVVHTAQDAFKIWVQPRLDVHLAWTYFADQAGHIALILAIGWWVGDAVVPGPFMQFSMAFCAALIIVTRAYEVSVWANWFSMIVYVQRWQTWGYAERVLMLVLAMLGPLGAGLAWGVALPRAVVAWQRGAPLWAQPAHMIEWLAGVLLAIALGYGWLHPLWRALAGV
ncbi:MAG: DUF3307 domain-containing protein [Anaerolineales bacterium]